MRPDSVRGFTLIELTAVILIIGIMTTAGFVSFERMAPRYRIRAEARKVANFADSVRTKAIRTGRSYTIYYDLESSRYWAEPGGPPGTADAQATPKVHRLPESILFDRVESRYAERRSGRRVAIQVSAAGAAPIYNVHLKEAGGGTRTFTVTFGGPSTRASIERGDNSLPDFDSIDGQNLQDGHEEYIQKNQ